MWLLDKLIGHPLSSDEEDDQKINVVTGIPTLGLDGLGSAAYGPEAALTVLLPAGALGLAFIGPITLVILGLLAILYLSYRQTISAYPTGGGSYTVARENLGPYAGLLAAAALILDYMLNVAVGISAGVGALVSAIPSLHAHTLPLCLGLLALIAVVNLRGARESGVLFAFPTYVFILTLAAVIVIGIARVLHGGGHPHPIVEPAPLALSTGSVGIWLMLRAFASGCTAMTGVEAVSNGVVAFKEPKVKYARHTLFAIVVILAFLLGGIAYLSHAYHIGAMDQTKPGYQSVLSQLIYSVMGRGAFYYISIGSVLAVLSLSANTSYAGFPRLCRLLAHDDYLPHSFGEMGRRLVYSVGITFLTSICALLLIIFGGVTDRLIPLFAIGAFLAFTMSQAGMVVHWRRELGSTAANDTGSSKNHARIALAINAVGVTITTIALIVITIAKFSEGAWITLLIIPMLIALFLSIKRHYLRVVKDIHTVNPIDLSGLNPPVVLVPIEGWNRLTARALRFGLRLSQDVNAVHILTENTIDGGARRRSRIELENCSGEERRQKLCEQWESNVEKPSAEAGIKPPKLFIIPSPYRKLHEPLLEMIDKLGEEHPDRLIAIIIPELVEASWWETFLHSHRAAWLKGALRLKGDRRVVIINMPWYMNE